jgi:hypothetical protein
MGALAVRMNSPVGTENFILTEVSRIDVARSPAKGFNSSSSNRK